MRRRFIILAAASITAAALAGPIPAGAASYPERPITLVIPLGAGGSHDLHARGITGIISDILGQPMIVKLLPGGAGMQGTAFAAQAKPDGYTVLFTHNGLDLLVPQTQKVPFNSLKDFKAVARVNYGYNMFITHPKAPFKTMKEFVEYAKKNPGKVNFGHSGVWGAIYTPAAQLMKETGIKLNMIPHKGGGPSLQALLSGQDDVGGAFPTQARVHVKAGKIIPLAVIGDTRIKNDPDFKDVPTTAELGYKNVSFVMDRYFLAPAQTPPDRLKVLQGAFAKLMEHPSFKAFMKNIGEPIDFMSGADYDKQRTKLWSEYTALIKEMTKR
ncbi:MAG: tripartite tricarboxylate transporter substrate binding protein [Candidatus Tectomicrobia bacterium]|uniref:Tripartite tricarboxylate transporter substrate binding protein n=1 Tax=Tectimicrobiota bacterium TaxID=2528274 RepID=A0A932HWF2_UNCTE|nr:tripartite tricarboxylate transporter substrate binding protein [Candidatus Tectomicrobia bacterium]